MTRQSRMLLVIVIFAIAAVVVLALMANRYASMLEERERQEVVDPIVETRLRMKRSDLPSEAFFHRLGANKVTQTDAIAPGSQSLHRCM